ncbi:Hypothetical_protein [Hexamita inflata]|uniref:Hypothetical_protein n=1 Tax=Hexamita inflata TaxID=28002 RepID=A0AA86PF61_9EUKA|nr:Hypothetical protein HINF_LOCUS24987 [Hexamita inflata]
MERPSLLRTMRKTDVVQEYPDFNKVEQKMAQAVPFTKSNIFLGTKKTEQTNETQFERQMDLWNLKSNVNVTKNSESMLSTQMGNVQNVKTLKTPHAADYEYIEEKDWRALKRAVSGRFPELYEADVEELISMVQSGNEHQQTRMLEELGVSWQ